MSENKNLETLREVIAQAIEAEGTRRRRDEFDPVSREELGAYQHAAEIARSTHLLSELAHQHEWDVQGYDGSASGPVYICTVCGEKVT